MSIGSILLGAALILLVGLFLARPFLLSGVRYDQQRTMRQELLNRKEAILTQIQVLEFDYETGTLPELDFKQQRRQLVAEAADTLKKLDILADTMPGADANADIPDDKVGNEIEAAISRLRSGRTPDKVHNEVENEIEAAVSQLRSRPTPAHKPAPASIPEKAAAQPQTPPPVTAEKPVPTNGRIRFCPQCGKPVDQGDNFCAYCGHQFIPIQST
ncbi:MAG: zinc ribbon domain-containing protein [Candidatus Promineifilaceae bacterium]